MIPQRQNNKRRKKNIKNAEQHIVVKEATSLGLVFQKTVNLRKINKTDLRSFPSSVIVGFAGKSNNILFEYESLIDGDKETISGFFSNMTSGEEFKIEKGSGEWTDGISKKTDAISGDYAFLSYKNNNIIIAEKKGEFGGEMYLKSLSGKYFIRPLVFSKETTLNSNLKISYISNFLKHKTFFKLGVKEGDTINIEGTQNNDGTYTVMEVKKRDEMESIVVSPSISLDEDSIGKPVKIQVIKNTHHLTKLSKADSERKSPIPSPISKRIPTKISSTTKTKSSSSGSMKSGY